MWSCCQCSTKASLASGQPQPFSFFQGHNIILSEVSFHIPFNDTLLSIQVEFDCELVGDE